MAEKLFLVKMDSYCKLWVRGYCSYLVKYKRCSGCIDSRPKWCPLVELEKRRFDDQVLYAEIEE